MGLISEFKAFAMRGNVVDMAVGVIIGAAFGKIVSTLVEKVMMPPIGMLMNGMDFSKMGIPLQKGVAEVKDPATGAVVQAAKPDVVIGYGHFLNDIINFVIVAFVLFMVIKAMNNLKKKEVPPPPPPPPASEQYLKEIRDLLAKR
jgi:large conductance mechanosensitive channel